MHRLNKQLLLSDGGKDEEETVILGAKLTYPRETLESEALWQPQSRIEN